MNDSCWPSYPEAVHPIRMLEGKANKATGQLCNGQRTYIEWKGPRIVFATVTWAVYAVAPVIETYASWGRIRGAQFTRPDGQLARPDFFLLDDPQTDRSADSRSPGNTGRYEPHPLVRCWAWLGPGEAIKWMCNRHSDRTG